MMKKMVDNSMEHHPFSNGRSDIKYFDEVEDSNEICVLIVRGLGLKIKYIGKPGSFLFVFFFFLHFFGCAL